MKIKYIIRYIKNGFSPNKLRSKKNLIVGENTYYNGKIIIKGAGKVTIGSYCAFGPGLRIISSNHNYNYPVLQASFIEREFGISNPAIHIAEDISIGNDVWTGDNVIILPGVTIGNGVVIGAGSVVTKDIPDYAIAAGVPAKIIKYRFSDTTIKRLLNIKWWDWDKKTMLKNKDFFYTNLNSSEYFKKQ